MATVVWNAGLAAALGAEVAAEVAAEQAGIDVGCDAAGVVAEEAEFGVGFDAVVIAEEAGLDVGADAAVIAEEAGFDAAAEAELRQEGPIHSSPILAPPLCPVASVCHKAHGWLTHPLPNREELGLGLEQWGKKQRQWG